MNDRLKFRVKIFGLAPLLVLSILLAGCGQFYPQDKHTVTVKKVAHRYNYEHGDYFLITDINDYQLKVSNDGEQIKPGTVITIYHCNWGSYSGMWHIEGED